ncbi:integrase [Rhizobium sp. Root708]|uniref:DUF6538 domain-containing protein n=1 Tax=Rhizobium sp. Root708 TaxID=1736592 RepID=UPI0006F656E9|nr:DUF6538 domain-containing protein [Rhizobium sp. Root708]KRB53792.1 integrase [Rhizobium sp. Root708]
MDRTDPDRYLALRNGIYLYKRRVPKLLEDLDGRKPIVRRTLKTRDLAKARALRDGYERADDDLWGALLSTESGEGVRRRYEFAVRRVAAMGFTYRTTSEILQSETGAQILERLRALTEERPNSLQANAILGVVERPTTRLSEAFKLYVERIAAPELGTKSQEQKDSWLKVKKRALTNFITLVGDKPIGEVTRDDALKFYNFWADRISPLGDAKKTATHKPTSGNRDIGNLRVLYKEYHEHLNVKVADNPFDKLTFSDKFKKARTRPPFTTEWITTRILVPGALAGLNEEARGIVLGMTDSGARPSELANIDEERIFLDAPVPYIRVEARLDAEDPRELKTTSSARNIPLVGVALAAFQKHPKGFPRYRNKGVALSACLLKHFKVNGLFPTKKHVIYSLRHSFEDRMKDAGIDTELRMILMGHSNSRPAYGVGGSLTWQRDELLKIVVPFDPSIV